MLLGIGGEIGLAGEKLAHETWRFVSWRLRDGKRLMGKTDMKYLNMQGWDAEAFDRGGNLHTM